MAMKLYDIALFAVCQDLWRSNHDNALVMNTNWRERTSQVISSVNEVYPNVPSSIQKRIITCVKLIGEEIIELINYRHFNCLFLNCLNPLRSNEIVWTSNFTIDRVKTLIAVTNFKTKVEGYMCPLWAKRLWQTQGVDPQARALRYFGNYRFWVFLNWVCYMKTTLIRNVIDDTWTLILRDPSRHVTHMEGRGRRHTFGDHLNYFKDYYEGNTPSENVFRFLVISGVVENIPLFLVKLCPSEQRSNVFLMTKLLITEYNNKHFRPSSHVLVSTLLYLWSNLEKTDKTKIIQDHFDEFFRFILTFPGTDILVAALNWYSPSVENLRSNRRYLEDTVAAMPQSRDRNDCFKQRLIFHILYKKFGCYLSEIDIINLIEKLLIIKDTETAVMIAQVLDNEKKDLLLDAIHKIWNDLWKDSVEKEIFLNFFFEVQSGLISSTSTKT